MRVSSLAGTYRLFGRSQGADGHALKFKIVKVVPAATRNDFHSVFSSLKGVAWDVDNDFGGLVCDLIPCAGLVQHPLVLPVNEKTVEEFALFDLGFECFFGGRNHVSHINFDLE